MDRLRQCNCNTGKNCTDNIQVFSYISARIQKKHVISPLSINTYRITEQPLNVNCSHYHMHETQRFTSETYTIDMKHEPKAPKSIYQLVETVYISKASKTKTD
ncbi:hypothetical protein IA829_12700 [Listeria seeligeri]|uniref:hypothetical protein n=1 Tax=Listeria seeligeri TaxID=1640 RepID=UPI00162851FF|nr:hypothetical protein [Listeria seeligeri]MBC1577717.1 hypothetical protein [Listeria seeligeri]MBC2218433.1 hypothetical protein [Listeria seeligeri]MBC2232031.1 hypothetical protein [Listeria seeligeri]MBC2247244.1 hypothetical protein [Listeria seeligeri]MBF2401678.1 hypothetical protein [Listeria seeligeri]